MGKIKKLKIGQKVRVRTYLRRGIQDVIVTGFFGSWLYDQRHYGDAAEGFTFDFCKQKKKGIHGGWAYLTSIEK